MLTAWTGDANMKKATDLCPVAWKEDSLKPSTESVKVEPGSLHPVLTQSLDLLSLLPQASPHCPLKLSQSGSSLNFNFLIPAL